MLKNYPIDFSCAPRVSISEEKIDLNRNQQQQAADRRYCPVTESGKTEKGVQDAGLIM